MLVNESNPRPFIEVINGRICMHDREARIVISDKLVSLGCTDITHGAMELLARMWDTNKPTPVHVIIQSGELPKQYSLKL